ncbi:MAG TPA: DUF308 domain-containing protein [Puia sp.]|jgi:uncharacterized membrane protein HdeD (DUF308 family)
MPANSTSKQLRYSWTFLLTGLLLTFAGVAALYEPLLTSRALGISLGIVIVLLGIGHISFVIANGHLPHRGWHILIGALDLLIGAVLLPYPDITIVVLPFLLGFWFLIRGLSMILYAFAIRRLTPRSGRGWVAAGGFFVALFAFFVIGFPVFGFMAIVTWTSFALIITGISNILLAFRLRGLREDSEETVVL